MDKTQINEKLKGLIKEHVASVPNAEAQESLDKLYQQFEKLAEDIGIDRSYHDSIRAYISENVEDLKSFRTLRKCVSWLACGVLLAGFATIMYLLLCPTGNIRFKDIGADHVKITIIIACFTLVFGLLALLLRGAFSTRKEEAVSLIPEQWKLIIEAAKGVTGK